MIVGRVATTGLVVALMTLCGSLPGEAGAQEIARSERSADQTFAEGFKRDTGLDGPVDRTAAAELYRQAAEAGHIEAQFHLAALYLRGDGVPRDRAEAYKWASLAYEKNVTLGPSLEAIEAALKPGEIAEGKRRANAWKRKQ